jgi:organic radical activating enzyme
MNEQLYVSEIFSSIQGEGMLAGRRQIFIRLTECNLDCSYCDTNYIKSDCCRLELQPGSGHFTDIPQPLSVQKISAIIADWQSRLPGAHHSISFTGGEPLMNADSLAEWFPEIRNHIPIHLETNGTMHLALKRVIEHVDFISMDMKLPSTSGCAWQLWELHHLFLKQSLGSAVSVKIVVGNSTDSVEINKVCDIIDAVDRATPLFLQPLTLLDGGIGISATHILYLQELASLRLPDVRVIPQMHKLLGVL